jgi:predicted alpha/beta hydrolase
MDGVERDFYVRQLRDGKGSIDVATLDPEGLGVYGGICAWTLARAHARSGDRVAIASYLGTSRSFDDAVATYALAYADVNARDHQALVDAIASGRITALAGV